MRSSPLRAAVRALAALAALGSFALTTPAQAATSPDPARVGLYGAQDPTWDGAYRQGLALLALDAVGVTPDPSAVSWLLRQQCADGGWTSFRADLAVPCAAGGEDTNSTALAVEALAALGRTKPAARGASWLVTQQNADGGWPYQSPVDPAAPNASDANSTAVVLQALRAAGTDPAAVTRGGLSGYDLLLTLRLGCSAAPAAQGAFDYQAESPLAANDLATAQVVQALAGATLPVGPGTVDTSEPAPTCPEPTVDAATAAATGAGYLARELSGHGGRIPSPWGSGALDDATANALLSLVAAGHGASQLAPTWAALVADAPGWAFDAQGGVPGALAQVVLAAHATGNDPTDVGGRDLVAALAATLTTRASASPTPTPTPSQPTGSATPTPSPATTGDASTGAATLPRTGGGHTSWLLAVGVAMLAVGAGLLAVGRRLGAARP